MINILIILPCLVALFWAVLLFLNRKKNTRPQNIWIVCLLVIAFATFLWAEYYSFGIESSFNYKWDVADIAFSLLIFPMIYIYFWSLTNKQKLTWKQYICCAPGLILALFSVILYKQLGEEAAADYLQKVIGNQESYYFEPGSLQAKLYMVNTEFYYLVVLAQAIVIMTYASSNILRYKRGLKNFFSNLDKKSIENNRGVLIGLYVMLFFAIIAFGIRMLLPEHFYEIKYVFMCASGISIYYMSYHVYKIEYATAELLEDVTAEATDDLENSNDILQKILPQFVKLIEEDKIFLQPNLSLDDIARQINSNRTYISRIINEKFDSNFYDFINSKRIAHAQQLIIENPMFTQEEISKESGFLHATNFSRAFKKHSGTTFREWRKEQLATNAEK